MLLITRFDVFWSSTGSPSPNPQRRFSVFPGVPMPPFLQVTLLPPVIATFAHGPVMLTPSRVMLLPVLNQPRACPVPVETVMFFTVSQSPCVTSETSFTRRRELDLITTLGGPAPAFSPITCSG